MNNARYSHSNNRQWIPPSFHRVVLESGASSRGPTMLPQPLSQQRRSMMCFEDHFDAAKALHEIPKLVDDEDIIHSYLTIDFEDEFIDTLHGITCDFKQQFEKACRPMKRVRYNHEWGEVIPLDIQIYSKEKLRTILLFDYYDTLFDLTPSRLCKYHTHLTRRLKKCGFLSTPSNAIVEPDGIHNQDRIRTTAANSSSDETVNIEPTTTILPPGSPTHHWYIRVKEFKLLPKRERNKLVVVFQPSPFWKHLHKQIQNLANRTNGLHRTMTVDECDDKWEPSISIAHVYNGMGGRSKYERTLQQLLPVMPFHQIDVSSKIQTISLSGSIPILPPVPTSATLQDLFHSKSPLHQPPRSETPPRPVQQLNWNFHFHGRPLLQIKERTDIQDSLPENFYHNSDDGDDDFDDIDDDDITDNELIADPLESYASNLDHVDLAYEKQYPLVEGWNQITDPTSDDGINNQNDEEIDTDDVIMNHASKDSMFKVPEKLIVYNQFQGNGNDVDKKR